MQKIFSDPQGIAEILAEHGAKKTLLVVDRAFGRLAVSETILAAAEPHVLFDSFTSNPLYEDVVNGVRVFREEGCDFLIAVGGGSTIDTAKAIKLFGAMDPSRNYLEQDHVKNGVPLLAVPTTAGTGCESTRFAVIYYNHEKQSLADDDLLPGYVLLDPSVLGTLPLYQKKCTMLDALCQAIESWWSVRSTEESRRLSERAVGRILQSMEGYLANAEEGNREMQIAANLAGQAINLAQTTAAHAMSYKLTSLYRLPHGHAAALCLPHVWRYMLGRIDACADPRGPEYLRRVFSDIAAALGENDGGAAALRLDRLLDSLGIAAPQGARREDLPLLARSVNPVRLKNSPVPIDEQAALELYEQILHL